MYNLTKVLGILGVMSIVFSYIWHLIYVDFSQFVIVSMMGIFIIGFAYVYEWMKRFQKEIEEHNQRIDSMDIWMKSKLNGSKKK